MVSTKLFDLSGKVALLTGSSKGMGRAMATGMAEHGAKVMISSRKLDQCQAVADAGFFMHLPQRVRVGIERVGVAGGIQCAVAVVAVRVFDVDVDIATIYTCLTVGKPHGDMR